ncbi:MAG: hypothetical protein WCO66_01680 [Candidatus Absconditabacteria bacterium]
MKTKLVSLFFILSLGLASAQNDWIDRVSTTLSARVGSNYAPLFGAVLSNDFGIYIAAEIQDTISGFGVGGYRLDNFGTDKSGRVGFIDLYWSKKITQHFTLLAALENGWFDNWKEGQFICPYTILSFKTNVVDFNVAPMYCYYPKTKTDEFVFRAQVKKEVIKGTEVQFTGWYHSALDSHYYASIGVKQQFPKNIYLQGDLLYKEAEFSPLLRLGFTL